MACKEIGVAVRVHVARREIDALEGQEHRRLQTRDAGRLVAQRIALEELDVAVSFQVGGHGVVADEQAIVRRVEVAAPVAEDRARAVAQVVEILVPVEVREQPEVYSTTSTASSALGKGSDANARVPSFRSRCALPCVMPEARDSAVGTTRSWSWSPSTSPAASETATKASGGNGELGVSAPAPSFSPRSRG
jgi:hypothetical protein